jgi:hypothetical protein
MQNMANHPHADNEALRMELQEAIVTFREQITLLVQIAGFLVAADAALLGYGFAQGQSVILLIASFIPAILVVIAMIFVNATLPVIYVAMTLEQELGLRKAPLATIFAMRMFLGISPEAVNLNEANLRDSIISAPSTRLLKMRAAYIMYGITALQIALFLIATFVAHFRFV